MNIVEKIDYSELEAFEIKKDSNARVGRYDMDKHCPISDGQCYKIKLHESDLKRLFILGDTSFAHLTKNGNFRLSDLISEEITALDRTKHFFDTELDLRKSPEMSPIFVTSNVNIGAIVAIDGNHRLMAHFVQHKTIEGLNGYLFVHPNMEKWGFMPSAARSPL